MFTPDPTSTYPMNIVTAIENDKTGSSFILVVLRAYIRSLHDLKSPPTKGLGLHNLCRIDTNMWAANYMCYAI